MDVEQIAKGYGGLPQDVVTRANEYLRLTQAKKGRLDSFAGPAACILVAAQSLGAAVDRKKLLKCASTTPRIVNPTMQKILSAVDRQKVVRTSPAALCIKFGCEALAEIVSRVLDEYRAYLGQMAASNRRKKAQHPLGPAMASTNEQDPVFVAACLYAVSKQAKMNVNRTRLLEEVCGNSNSFDAIVTSIEAQCQSSLSGALGDRKKRRATASELASKRLLDQQKRELEEDEERVKRRKQDQEEDAAPMTISQQRLLQQLRAAGSSTPRSPGSARRAVSAATPEEYAEWRAMALEFMRAEAKGSHDL